MLMKILTPIKKIYSNQNVFCITLYTIDGVISIYDDHASLITILAPGAVSIEYGNNEKNENLNVEIIFIPGGILSIHNNEVTLLSDDLLTESEITNNFNFIQNKIDKIQRQIENQSKNSILDDYYISKIEGLLVSHQSALSEFKK